MAPSSERHRQLVADLASWQIVPVLRTNDADLLLHAAHAIAEHGWGIVELTATSPGWQYVLRSVRKILPTLVIGVGTLAAPGQARAAVDGGADFLVTPGYRPDLVAAADGVPFVPGAATPTEIDTVSQEVGDLVKVFPATQLGGPEYLCAIRAVQPALRLVPTGGIGLPDVPAYLDAGAAAVGVGGSDWFADDKLCNALCHMDRLRITREEEQPR